MRNPKTRLYIAYGSNLNLEQMKRRCPTAKVVGTAFMRNWQLVFNGVATIERCKGGIVPVLVWDIRPQDEDALDIYEGWPRMYRKESVRVTLNGKQVRAMVYIMNGGRPSPISQIYYNTIREGYISAGFDIEILRTAVNRSKRRKTTMTQEIREQILAVRDTGRVNMLSVNEVQRIAYEMDLYELVNFIEDDRKAYISFIFTGEASEEEDA